jgi:hypothetical protein
MALAMLSRPVESTAPLRTRRIPPDKLLLGVLLLIVLIVQGWNIADYPTVSDDEGTYLAQAWAVQHGHGLAPYTYWYDHPPLGWLQIALFSWIPALFSHGRLITAYARVIMLPFTAGDVALLYFLTKRLTKSQVSAVLAGALFALGPLSVTLQREVFLDNFAVFWILLAFVLVTSPRSHLWLHLAGGAAAACAVLSKETMVIALPGLAVALWQHAHRDTRKFSVAGFVSCLCLLGIFYPLYAILKGELLPGPGHVSLWGGLTFQMGRPGSGFIFTPGSGSNLTLESWFYYDPVLIVLGVAALAPCLFLGRMRGPAVSGLCITLMALRPGGYLPAMYVIQALPFFALCVAAVAHKIVRLIATRLRPPASYALVGVLALVSALVIGPRWVAGDATALTADSNLTYTAAAAWMQANLHPDSHGTIVVDDGLWLNAVADGYQPGLGAIWFYKVDLDPAVEAALPEGWRSIQYVVSTPTIRNDLSSLPTVAAALRHSRVVAVFGTGSGSIEICQVIGAVQ